MQEINFNGNVIPADQAIFTANNRAFKYGDSLFETIRVFNGKMPFLSLHFDRLIEGMTLLGMEIPDDFSIYFLQQEIHKLIQQKGNWRLRVMAFRSDGGLYTPINNSIHYLIEKTPLDNDQFILNKKGLKLGITKDKLLFKNKISHLKKGNSLPYILATKERERNNWDDVLILNHKGQIAEAISSNVFIIINNKIITPPLKSGCVAGTIRRFLLESSTLKIKEKNITIKTILKADAIFLTNAIQGLKWVEKINDKEFEKSKKIKKILSKLNAIRS